MTESAKPLIVGLGELLWDLLPDGKQLGGAPANFAYQAHALGADARVVSAVGADELGREAVAQLRQRGVESAFIVTDPFHATGTVEVSVNAQGQPRYTIVESVAWDFIPLSDAAAHLAAQAHAICFGTLAQRAPTSRETIRTLLQRASPRCLRILDINLRPPFVDPAIVRESCGLADALKLNDEEFPMLAEMLGCDAREARFFTELFERYRFRLIALTRGADGATLVTPNERLDFPGAPPRELVDTVGAGDAFTAAMTVGWLRHLPLAHIGANAIRVASYVCSLRGAMPDMRAVQELFAINGEQSSAQIPS
jgi:fructokinase